MVVIVLTPIYEFDCSEFVLLFCSAQFVSFLHLKLYKYKYKKMYI
jgi:hypothetical protein